MILDRKENRVSNKMIKWLINKEENSDIAVEANESDISFLKKEQLMKRIFSMEVKEERDR